MVASTADPTIVLEYPFCFGPGDCQFVSQRIEDQGFDVSISMSKLVELGCRSN